MPYADYEKQKENSRRYYQEHREVCHAKQKIFYQQNRERLIRCSVDYYRKNIVARSAYHKHYHRKRLDYLKEKMFALLGDKCSFCGFDDKRALQIDHINGGGVKELKMFTNQMSYLKRVLTVGKKEYQILCANCNWIKRHEKDEQPKRKRVNNL